MLNTDVIEFSVLPAVLHSIRPSHLPLTDECAVILHISAFSLELVSLSANNSGLRASPWERGQTSTWPVRCPELGRSFWFNGFSPSMRLSLPQRSVDISSMLTSKTLRIMTSGQTVVDLTIECWCSWWWTWRWSATKRVWISSCQFLETEMVGQWSGVQTPQFRHWKGVRGGSFWICSMIRQAVP